MNCSLILLPLRFCYYVTSGAILCINDIPEADFNFSFLYSESCIRSYGLTFSDMVFRLFYSFSAGGFQHISYGKQNPELQTGFAECFNWNIPEICCLFI